MGSEGVLLRYLSDVYKALLQTVPDQAKDAALGEIIEWLGAVVRQTDASLLDEWEKLRNPEAAARPADSKSADLPAQADVTADPQRFEILVRNALFRLVRHLARRDYARAIEELDEPPEAARMDPAERWGAQRLEQALAPFWDEHGDLRTDGEARSARWLRLERNDACWRAYQTLLDPESFGDWQVAVDIDIVRSREEQRPVICLHALGPIGSHTPDLDR
jgi:hypothetical protein